ncbi:putative basal body-orientation factor 1 [Scophthalmus maximus]|uniref:Basal body-orientation factor 1 n=1 Tax=Scophthalmus maximus TaxID=52904 RepID=A0A2U9CK44_SCOMX|nr:putative basal body-orientation factor 1 [Scophthalmus maximus]
MPKKKAAKVKKVKGGKGKKDGKQEARADKESDVEKAKAAAALWELRLNVADQSLVRHREDWRALARVNEELTNRLHRLERDTVDISACLQRKDAAKEQEITLLQIGLKNQEALAREEQNKLAEDYTLQINEMKELFRKRSSDFDMIQEGMKTIKEFQKTKAQMEQELNDTRESMGLADKEHRENLNKMEYKFFKEKARLEREAERAIAVAVDRAHNEAIVQLDDASRSVFKENVRLNEALRHHIKEAEDLQKLTSSLAKQNASLALDKNTFELMVKKNAAQMAAQKEELSKLRAKVDSLQQALDLKARELEQEEKKEAEEILVRKLGHVKRLASTIVEQRTELEQFFHESLAQVRQEIAASRLQYKKEALRAYRWRLTEATAGKLKFPPIRTFQKGPHSTNSVYSDMEAAATWTHQPGSKVEISDLTWEQKEQVLRLLFAKMNGQKERKVSQHLASSAKRSLIDSDAAGIREELSPATFITQAPESLRPSNPNSLPDVHTR